MSNINSNEDLTINISTIKIKFNANIIIKMIMKYIFFNKKEIDKVKDIDIIISNYIMMKKELDELKDKQK